MNRLLLISFTVVYLMFFSGELCAQDPGFLTFNHLTQKEGLSQSTGQAIFQDSKGFMWFGTSNGLNKYNGYNITVYQHDPGDSTSLSGNNISYIYEDSRENLWIGTTGAGLNLFDRDSETFTSFKIDYNRPGEGISDNSVTSILETRQGNFWIGTYNGLNLFDRDTFNFTQFHSNPDDPESLSNNYINSLFEDRKGNLWIGTNEGLNLWNAKEGSFTHFKHDSSDFSSISGNIVMDVYEDKKGILWIGTTEGLNRLDTETGKFSRFTHNPDNPESISGNAVFSVMEDSRGVLWVGTENEGLNAMDSEKGTFRRYSHNLDDPNGLNNNAIYNIYENNDNILWIGTYAGGINYIDRKKSKFEHYKYNKYAEHPLSTNSVTSFLEDSQNNFWIGTDGGGLNRFDRSTGNFYPLRHDPNNSNSLASDVVLALMEGKSGEIWIGYYRGGLSRYNVKENKFKHYRKSGEDPNSLCHDEVFALFKDKDENVWIGTNGGGVCMLDPDTDEFTHYEVVEGVVRDILIDSRDRYWVATYGGGLKLLSPGTNDIWNFYEGDHGLYSNVILTIHEDKKKNLWIGTKEAGLNHFDSDSLQFTSYNTRQGLPGNEVKGILEDDEGNFWLSTNNGLSRFNPQSETFFNYSLEDGLQADEFNTLAYYKDRQGYMYFGGINGFNRFHPDSIKTDPASYPIVFTDIKIFNRSVEPGEESPLDKHVSEATELIVPHSASVLTFEYAALNFNTVKGIRYAYMLEGFEDDWNYVEKKRSTTYTNLSPGEYTFKVKASNTDGVWNEEEARLAIIVTPPFWRTIWFYILSALLIGGSIIVIYRFRVRQITLQNRLLFNKVTERTSELHEKNDALQSALEDLQGTRSELVEKAHKAGMADIATGVMHNIGNVLNSIGTSTAITGEVLKKSKFEGLYKANSLLLQHTDDLAGFLTQDPKGKKLIEYYQKLNESIKAELQTLREHNLRMEQKVQLINNVITAQQNYASVGLNNERADLETLVEDALVIYTSSLERHKVTIKKNFEPTEPVFIQKTKLIHIFLNLLKNAKDAITASGKTEKEIILKLYQKEEQVFLEITDNGTGIKNEHLQKIFTHGFTTKKDGHGFGLHSSANYMAEMGANIRVESQGENKGTTFIMSFPVATASRKKFIKSVEQES